MRPVDSRRRKTPKHAPSLRRFRIPPATSTCSLYLPTSKCGCISHAHVASHLTPLFHIVVMGAAGASAGCIWHLTSRSGWLGWDLLPTIRRELDRAVGEGMHRGCTARPRIRAG